MKQLLLSSFALAVHAPAGAARGQALRVGCTAGAMYMYQVQVRYLFGKPAEAE